MAEQDLDRNEAATPYKLEKARDKGQVARSSDVVSTIVFTVAVASLALQGESLMRSQFVFDRALFTMAARADAPDLMLLPLIRLVLQSSLVLLAPIFAALVLAAIVGNLLQTGFVLSAEPLKPDWQRINPVTGLKRVFSLRTLFDAARACLKLLLLTLAVWLSLREILPHFHSLSSLSVMAYTLTLIDDLVSLGFRMALMLGLIALVDLLFTQREFAKKMRMSVREQKDEVKNREGDPRIRMRLRQLRFEMLKKSLALRKTKDADVVITNPTHISVALKYRHGEMASPIMLAKGAGQLARSMRDIAARHQIPVVQNPLLARRLMREMDVDHHVPEHLYADVAKIIVWVFAARERYQALTVPSPSAP
jgi:flagellar biosynthetic protein FlhB